MASPYLCSTCRARLLVPKPRIGRLLSQPAYTKQQQHGHGRAGIGSLFDGEVGAGGRGTPGRHEANESRSNTARGRYSGKELRPEELLGQLEHPIQSQATGEGPRRTSQLRPRPQFTESSSVQRQTYDQKQVTDKRASRLPPTVHTGAQQFATLVQSQQWVEAWAALQGLAKQLCTLGRQDAQTLFRVDDFEPSLRRLLTLSTKQWLEGISLRRAEETQPTPVDVLTLIHSFSEAKPSIVRPLLWHASSGLAELHSSMAGNTQNNTAFVNGVRSLVNMWRMTMARHLRRGSTVAAMETSGWDFLPSRTVFDQQVPRSHHMFEQMLGMLVPVPQSSASTTLDPAKILRNADYASSALVTLELLRSMERSKSSLPSEPDILPFVNLLSKLLKIAPAPRTPYSFQEKLFALKDDPAELAYYREMGNRLHLEHMQLPGPSHASEFGAEGSTPPSAADSLPGVEADPDHDALESAPTSDVSQTDRFALLHYKRLARALAQQDMLLAEKIKRETYAFAGSRGADSQALPLELYEHLMLTFLSLRNPKAAIEVWNHVIQAGYTPTVKTYSVMMRGAQAVRDVSGMKAFWQKMRNAGLQPDEHAWSIRIYGLIKLQLVKEGFQAMNEMAQEWMAAAKAREMKVASRERKKEMATNQNLGAELLAKYSGPVDGVPRPSLVVVNSAVSSLAQSQRGEIPKALTWARTFGVEPDITTYNVLLNVAMRYEQADEALKLLRHMQQRGVAADSATWTVLLTALFEGGFLEGLDHKQQQEKVLSFIKSLETNNPKMPGIDVKGYALVIDRLLKRYDNPEGAAAVMNHMVVRGLQPTTHIYTILMSSYFQRRPQPDLAAVEALWKYIESQNKGYGAPVDSVFYDRMIEGYATHHRLLPGGVSTALGFLKRCRQAGQKPGWRALEMVSRALAERQEWNQLKVLVDDVRSSLREGRGASQHMGQRNFWRFIIEGTDLLREEGITRPEDLLPSDPRRSPLLQAEASAEAL